MKAWTIHKYFVCKYTGECRVEYSFAVAGGELKCFLKEFTSSLNAIAWLEVDKRYWLLGCLETYVNHKRHIIDNGIDHNKKAALKICMDALIAYEGKSNENICKLVLRGLNYYSAILPAQDNPSYKTSYDNLTEIHKFCKTELNQTP